MNVKLKQTMDKMEILSAEYLFLIQLFAKNCPINKQVKLSKSPEIISAKHWYVPITVCQRQFLSHFTPQSYK